MLLLNYNGLFVAKLSTMLMFGAMYNAFLILSSCYCSFVLFFCFCFLKTNVLQYMSYCLLVVFLLFRIAYIDDLFATPTDTGFWMFKILR